MILDEWTANRGRSASHRRYLCDFIEAYIGTEINIIRYFERNNSTNKRQRLENVNVLFQEVTANPDNGKNRARDIRESERFAAQYESLHHRLAEDIVDKVSVEGRKSIKQIQW